MKLITVTRCLCLSVLLLSCAGADENRARGDFSWWQALELRDVDGAELPITGRWVVLGFLDPECPVANAYVPVLDSVAETFRNKGVQVIGVYTDRAVPAQRLRDHVREFSIAFPVLQDRHHQLLRLGRVTYSSEVAVVDGHGMVLYHGRIDNRVGENGASRPKATQHDLQRVLDRLCAGEAGPFPTQPGFGCFLPDPARRP